MIIALTSQKGGVGKSTLATNIAVALAHRGADVMLIDADRQATSANWSAERSERTDQRPLPVIHIVQKYGRIRSTLEDLGKRYDFVVADCAGRDSEEMRTALFAADIAVIPIRCSQPDITTLKIMNINVEEARELNPKLKAFILLNQVPTNPVIKEEDGARGILCDFPHLKALEARICDRKIFRDAIAAGQGVVELGNGKASEEVLSLIREVGLV